MNEPITIGQILAEVRKVAAERPDFVYIEQEGYEAGDGCSYIGANPRTPGEGGEGCIVGQALVRLGVSPGWLAGMEARHGGIGIRTIVDAMHGRGWISDREEGDKTWLSLVQCGQDSGMAWGVAVLHADKVVEAGR